MRGAMTTKTVTEREVVRLRSLARRVSDIAGLPEQREKIEEWKRHNTLQPGRPMILCYPEGAWSELIPDSVYECRSALARRWEAGLVMRIYYHEHIPDDTVITDTIDVPDHIHGSGNGVTEHSVTSEGFKKGACHFEPVIRNMDDLAVMHPETYTLDEEATRSHCDLAREIFGEILHVRRRTVDRWRFAFTKPMVKLIGVENTYLNMYDNPELLHGFCRIMAESYRNKLEFFRGHALFCSGNGNDRVGSGGIAWTDELSRNGSSNGKVFTSKNVWAYGEAQELSSVSAEMFNEFAFQYQVPLLREFGLSCYGCCEPPDDKWPLLEQIPNLRRVSISPWANQDLAAEACRHRYVFSRKPNPAMLAMDGFDEAAIRSDIRTTLKTARGCNVEFVMKDTHTVRNKPERIRRWAELARREINSWDA